MNNYDEIMRVDGILTDKQASTAYNLLVSIIPEHDPDFSELYDMFVASCVRYATIRGNWNIATRDERLQSETSRTTAHNNVLTNLNIIDRYLSNIGVNSSWHDMIGHKSTGAERKTQGDFACFVAYMNALQAR